MKLGIVIYSNEAEVVWNAFRLANFSLGEKDTVNVFLLAKGVEYESLSNEKYNIVELAQKVLDAGGKILACGTCLKQRHKDGSELCPLSTMKDLYQIIKDSDKVLTF
ncbi:MAG: sulfur reduction protein DsrE [Candidatus Firestonebacteria bacterium RIFOXYC2_FULL_39_67]|nr:MAG: sulfur reduction protein DsrE [Candidatus Firestonebacteria bacterium RIFOXYC2_FULL_39_67]